MKFYTVPNVGAGAAGAQNTQIKTHFVKSLAATLLCAFPFGFGLVFGGLAIVYAAQVKPLLNAQAYESAAEASSKAAIWSTTAFVMTALFFVLSAVVAAVGGSSMFDYY